MSDQTSTGASLLKKRKKIGVFFGWRDPAYGAYLAARHFGASIVCCFSCKSYSELIKELKSRELDGYIFVSPNKETTQLAETLHAAGIPVCVVLRETTNVPSINADTRGLTTKIVDYFVSMGHKDIAIITAKQNEQGRIRLQGYLDGLAKNNLPVNENLIIDFGAISAENQHSRYDKIYKCLDEKHPFTAIVISGRWGILSLLNVASNFGYEIPKDFAAFTLDDPCEFPDVKEWISHAPLPAFELGWEAVKTICENIDNPPIKIVKRELPCRMIIRTSCGGRTDRQHITANRTETTTPLTFLKQTLEQTFPKYFAAQAKIICNKIEDIVENRSDKEEALFRAILEMEEYGLQYDLLASATSIVQEYAQKHSNIPPKDMDQVFQRIYARISERLVKYKRPKDFQFPGQPRISRFYPQTTGRTNSFESSLDELKRQLSNRSASKIVLKLEPVERPTNKVFFWESPVNRNNLQQTKILNLHNASPLFEFTRSENQLQSLFLDFEIERQGHQWIYLEIDPEECFQCLEVLFQFVNGYKTFQTYAKQRQNSTELKLAKHEAISSQKQAESALEAARAIHHAKNNFLAGMSHEIRTPMSNIIGLTELLSETKLNAQQRKQLDMVQSSMASLIGITDEILNFSAIESGKIQMENIEFNLRDTLSNLTQSIAFRAEEKGLELISRIQSTLPETLIGDPNRLRQILLNLIGNAIKFTNEGYVSIDLLQVSSSETMTTINFKVSDSGIGIPADKREHIFESFEQADSSTTRRYGGTGLGLTICKRLIEHMGSQLVIESAEGEGSEFSFQIEFETPANKPKTKTETKPILPPNTKLLLIESDPTQQANLEEMLKQLEIESTSATNALSGFGELVKAKTEGNEYSCLLINAQLPSVSGYELIRQIKGSNTYQGPIIAMTSASLPEGEIDALRGLDIDGFVTLPIKAGDLKETLLNACRSEQRTIPIQAKENDDAPTANKPLAAKSLNILLAEDNQVNVAVVIGFLETRGHTITHVDNGEDAIKACESQRFDLILMDIQMPGMDGLEATRRIREKENGTGEKTRIIAMTARAMEGDQDECLSSGMDDYVSKPFKKEALIKAVESEQ